MQKTYKKIISKVMLMTVILLFLLNVVLGCVDYGDFYDAYSWRLNTEELHDEYFVQFENFISVVFEDYKANSNIKYTKEVEYEKKEGNYKCTTIYIYFEDGYRLWICLINFYGTARIVQRLTKAITEKEEVLETSTEYFEIMHAINQFTAYKLQGDINTYWDLINKLINGIYEGIRMYPRDAYGYSTNIYEEKSELIFLFKFSAFLKDDNIQFRNDTDSEDTSF